MKYKCHNCGIEKEEDEFYSSPKDRKSPHCLVCLDVLRVKRNKRVKRNRELRANLKSVPCGDCSNEYPSYVMDFDHTAQKKRSLSRVSYLSEACILDEASRCEITCANCHRIRTHDRGQNKNRPSKNIFIRKTQYTEDWRPEGPFTGRTKWCSGCQKILPIEWFSFKSKVSKILAYRCRTCLAKMKSNWHQDHPKNKLRQKSNRATRKKQNLAYTTAFKEEKGCQDCKRRPPAYVLDFDHITDNKRSNVSQMVSDGCSLEAIIEEIAKCEVICANCHRIRTHERRIRQSLSDARLV